MKANVTGGRRIALRQRIGAASAPSVVYWLLTDHLGSTNVTLAENGERATELLYYPYGAVRHNANNQVTDRRFTGQWREPASGLYFYGARWYDSGIGRFIQADTIVPQPGNPQSLNRYSYAGNNALKYTDPSGYCVTNEQEITRNDAYDCTVDEMAQLTWETRKWWLEMFMKQSGAAWFQNILGILDYFGGDSQFSSLDGWASLADAGVLVVIQDGWRQFNGWSTIDSRPEALQASSAWREFFRLQALLGDKNPGVHSQWGLAEQAGVNFGTAIAEPLKAGADPLTEIKIDTFVGFGNFYRSIISQNAELVIALNVSIFDPRTEQSRQFVEGFSSNVISPISAALWGQYQAGTNPYAYPY